MAVETFLRGTVVVRRDEQCGIRAELLAFHRHLDGLARGIRSRARDHQRALFRHLHGEFDHAEVLRVIERGRFAGGAHGDDARDASGDLRLDEAGECGLVEPVIAERCDERGVGPCKHKGAGFRRGGGGGQRDSCG